MEHSAVDLEAPLAVLDGFWLLHQGGSGNLLPAVPQLRWRTEVQQGEMVAKIEIIWDCLKVLQPDWGAQKRLLRCPSLTPLGGEFLHTFH